MRAEYAGLKQAWGGFAGYDGWFEQPLNNAQLASVAIYSQLVPGFEQLLRDSGGDLPRFYAQVRELAKLPSRSARRGLPAEPARRTRYRIRNSRSRVPIDRARDLLLFLVLAQREDALGALAAVACRALQPLFGDADVLGHAVAVEIEQREVELRRRVALIGGERETTDGLRNVARRAQPFVVHGAEVEHRFGAPVLAASSEPFACGRKVVCNAVPVQIDVAEEQCCLGIAIVLPPVSADATASCGVSLRTARPACCISAGSDGRKRKLSTNRSAAFCASGVRSSSGPRRA